MLGKILSDEHFPWREPVSVLSRMSNNPLYREQSFESVLRSTRVRGLNCEPRKKNISEKLPLKGSRSGNMLPESELGENWIPEKVIENEKEGQREKIEHDL